ncbi:MAG: C45 family peptidase [Phenylobacterium sp.]|uniref:C45 family peptidase n=1 Tax=Phenylobacterium sp. TaxID=1871053 RepID=UPI002735D0D3|nr:C45 family peptidase [Phenylobacterium sp.]MDP3747505.1 C45 family peptidase [Phenylobacterium sp.]
MIEIDAVLAGGPADFTEARRLVLSGTHQDMGQHLATLGAAHYGSRPAPAPDAALVRARRAWFEEHWPAQAERMRGAAIAFGVDYEDDSVDLGAVPYLMSLGGCSVAWHPPGRTIDGHGRLSRNYDFSTGTLAQFVAGLFATANGAAATPIPASTPEQLAMTARPHVIECYPDTGHATLLVRAYDLLGGCLDGVNSAGLTVALLADLDASGAPPSWGVRVGLNELELGHFLLETCATVEEALEALASIEHYAASLGCHYILGDRGGASAVWEPFAPGRAAVVAGAEAPLVVTNHQLTRFPSVAELPDTAGEGDTYRRMRVLTELTSEGSLTPAQIAAAAAAVRFPAAPDSMIRTLWNAQYDVEALTLDIDFYLHDQGDAPRYSPRLRLALDPAPIAAGRAAA